VALVTDVYALYSHILSHVYLLIDERDEVSGANLVEVDSILVNEAHSLRFS
jgi:hypothetical protein